MENIEDKAWLTKLDTLLKGNPIKSFNPDTLSTNNSSIDFLKAMISGYNNRFGETSKRINAYEDFLQALKYTEDIDDPTYKKTALIAILDLLKSEIFIGSQQYESYLEYFRELKETVEDDIQLILYEIVFYSKADEDLDIDFNYYDAVKRMDAIFENLSETHSLYPYYLHEKGIQYKLDYQYYKAIDYFLKTERLCKGKSHLNRLEGTTLWQISDCYLNAKNYTQAKSYLKKSRASGNTLKDTFFDDRLDSKILAATKVYDSAYYQLKNSVSTEYKLGYKNNTLESSILAVENETERLKSDKLLLDNKRRLTQSLLITTAALLFLGSFIAVLLHKNNRKKRILAEQKSILEQQKVENLLKNQELISIDAMISGQEQERQKVANELHDDLGSLMATIKLHFANISRAKDDDAVEKTQHLLDEAYQKVRNMAHTKNSGVIANRSLIPAVEKIARILSASNTITVTIEDYGMDERLENSLELTIFRIVQELITNVVKHAKASKAHIQFTRHEDNLNIIIEDNGIGFNRNSGRFSNDGMGLGSIEKRVELMGGNFTIDSILEKGTSILIDIPI